MEEVFYQFAGDDDCVDCRGWDGESYRCDCGSRRVYWECEKGRSCNCKDDDQRLECEHAYAVAD